MKKKYHITKVKFLYCIVVLTTIIYIGWRAFFTIPFEFGIFSCVFGILLFVAELLGGIETIQHCYGMGEELIPDMPEIDEDDYPDVDVFIATYNEPCDLLLKTVNGCLYMKYPDLHKVHIYLLDDGNRKEVEDLAKRLGVGYITRQEHQHAKAGNLNNALAHTSSPLVATFDADMIPLSDFLMKTVPYFLLPQYEKVEGLWVKRDKDSDLKIGFIQSPQCFYNPDLFQYNLFSENNVPNEQDYFYRDVQLARNKTNSAIYGGSNTVLSRKALEEIGGFFTGVITEDFATGISIQSQGYTCYAIPDVLAIGLSPTDLKSLIKQRERWARGCIQTLRRVNIITRKGLSLGQKISYLSSLLYWYTPLRRLMYILSPILFAVFQIQVVKCSFLDLLLWWLPQYLVYQYVIKQFSNNIRINRLSNIYDTILFPSLLPAVFLETFGISQRKFSVTNKERVTNDRFYHFQQSIVHILLFLLSILSLIKCIREIFMGNGNAYVIVFFWTIVNMYSLLMAIFFMMGRDYFRKSERFFIEEAIRVQGIKHICITQDLSDTGLSFVCSFPSYLPTDEDIHFSLKNIEFKGRVRHVEYIHGYWKYGIEITDISFPMQQEYFHLIYDREPTLPSYVSRNHSFFDELSFNILKRRERNIPFNRRLVRLILHKSFITKENIEVICLDFNYEYMLVESQKLYEKFVIELTDELHLECIKEKDFQHKALYKITNYQSLIQNQKFLNIVDQWALEHEQKMNQKTSQKPVEEKEFNERLYY